MKTLLRKMLVCYLGVLIPTKKALIQARVLSGSSSPLAFVTHVCFNYALLPACVRPLALHLSFSCLVLNGLLQECRLFVDFSWF